MGSSMIKLRRGHESDIRVSDISISRTHAIIKFKNNGFYIEDNISKFGTLLLIQKPINLLALNTAAIQIGRTVIQFSNKKNFNSINNNKIIKKDNEKENLEKVT